jgi:uncharacterized RDD family membrane protein YckC
MPPAAPGGDTDAEYRRGVRRNERDQLGFTFPAEESADTLAPADETQATLAEAKASQSRSKTQTQTQAQTNAGTKTQTATGTQTAASRQGPRPDPFDGMVVEEGTGGTTGGDESSSYDSGTHWSADSEVETEANTWVEVYKQAANFGRRAMAMCIDGAVFLVLFGILVYALQRGGDFQILRTANVPAYLFLLVLHGFYFTFFHAATGQTPGKMLFGIRVVSTYGGNLLSPWDAFMRWIGYFLSAAPAGLGFLWAILDQDDRALHDRFAKSVVVLASSEKAAGDDAARLTP